MSYIYDDFSLVSETKNYHYDAYETERTNPAGGGGGGGISGGVGIASETPRLRNATRKSLDKNPLPHGTSLHKILSSRDATVSSLHTQLLTFPSQASVKDERGRLPLHLLSLNKQLLLEGGRSSSTKKELKDFVTELVKRHPAAVIARDNDGYAPFSYSLIDWITFECGCGCHDDLTSLDDGGGGASRMMGIVGGSKGSGERSIMSGILKPFSFYRKSDIQMHATGGAKGDGNEDAPSVSAGSTAPSATPSACNSTWSYRYERRPDIRSAKQLNTHRETFNYSSYYGDAEEGCSISSSSSTSGPSAIHAPNAAHGTAATGNHHRHNGLLSSHSFPSIMQGWSKHEDEHPPPPPSVGGAAFTSGGGGSNDSYLFPKEQSVKVTELVLTSLEILDHIYKTLPTLPRKESRQENALLHVSKNHRQQQHLAVTAHSHHSNTADVDDPKWLASALLSSLSATPNLAKVLHFCDDLTPRNNFGNVAIVPLILTSSEAIGNWIVYMIESTQFGDRGVSYLELFDDGDDDCFTSSSWTESDTTRRCRRRRTDRSALFERIERLDYILPSLLTLGTTSTGGRQRRNDNNDDDDEKEDFDLLDRAARTTVWECICRENFAGRLLPWVVADFVARAVLVVTFHAYTRHFLQTPFASDDSNGDDRKMMCNVLFNVGAVAVLYLWIREMNYCATVFKITSATSYFWRFVGGFWHVVDFGMLSSSFGMLLWMHLHGSGGGSGEGRGLEVEMGRKLLGVTTILIWVELLGWMRLVNWDIAFFMGILGKVLKDIRYYMVIIAIFILSSSQLFQIFESQSCSTSSSSECINIYLQTYSTFLGSFDMLEYTTNPSTIALFIIFTSITLFLFLTTLLSIVYNSFSLASLNCHPHRPYTSQTDRLIYLTHTKAIHTLFTTPWTFMQFCAAILFLATLGVLMVLSTDEQRTNMIKHYGSMTFIFGLTVIFLFMLVSIMAFLTHITFYNYTAKRNYQNSQWYAKVTYCFGTIFYPLKWATRKLLLGYDDRDATTTGTKRRSSPVIRGVEKTMQRQIASCENRFLTKIREEMDELERNVELSNRNRQTELITEVQSSRINMEEVMAQMQVLASHMKSIADAAAASSSSAAPSSGFEVNTASLDGSLGVPGRSSRSREYHREDNDGPRKTPIITLEDDNDGILGDYGSC